MKKKMTNGFTVDIDNRHMRVALNRRQTGGAYYARFAWKNEEHFVSA